MTSISPRRSGRSRHQATSYYEDEKKRIEQQELLKSNEKSELCGTDDSDNEEIENEEGNETETDSMQLDDDEGEDEDESSDEEYEIKKATSPRPRKAPTKKSKTPPKSNSKSKSTVKSNTKKSVLKSPLLRVHANSSRRKRNNTATVTKSNPKTIQNALQLLSNKIFSLDPKNKNGNERLKNSLFTSLLQSYRQSPSSSSRKKSSSSSSSPAPRSYHENDVYYTQPVTKYTNQLTQIAFKLVDEFNATNNPTSMHIQLLNLLFLSIGGTHKSMLLDEQKGEGEENHRVNNGEDSDMEEVEEKNKLDDGSASGGQAIDDLEDLDSEDWNGIITNLVNDMRNTPLEYISFCCDPNGALHWNAMQSMNNAAAAAAMDEDEDEDDDDKSQKHGVNVVSERDVIVKKGNSSLILAVKEYRSIFEEFWYIFGTVALVEGGMSNSSNAHQDDEVNDDNDNDSVLSSDGDKSSSPNKKRKRNKSPMTNPPKKVKRNTNNSSFSTSTTRFDSEIVVNILSRINEFVSAGQPDVRAAATTAALFLLHAIVDKTAFVQDRLEVTKRQYDAATGVKGRSGTGAKVKSLKHQIDSLERTLDDLEHVIETFFINAIFMHRYRDSNMYIRSSCLHALGRMTIIRPDFFFKDKYMKYFGWMMSDKAECVRVAALSGLYNPFQFKESQQNIKIADKIDLTLTERVVNKFLPRIVDCAIDIHESVQEVAMKMMLSLMRNSFLEELDDKEEDEHDLMSDEMWDQVNLMALENETSPSVRRDALYFIMEQLEDFDDNDDDDIEDTNGSNTQLSKKKTKAISSNISDRRLAQRLDAIASWAAHTLTAGKIPIEKIRIHLVDHLVHSIRLMPEHKSIVTNWAAMVRAITEDNIAMTTNGISAGERADVAKQRVLVQMLICAAKAEVESTDPDFLHTNVDPDVVSIMKKKTVFDIEDASGQRKKAKNVSTNLHHEGLSIALIKALPNLLVQFKSDSTILDSLVSLPRYFIPSVFNLSLRKSDFVAMTKNLTDIFLQSNDEKVLINCALSLASLCKGDHARVVEAKAGVKNAITKLHDRILVHLSVNQSNKDKESSDISEVVSKDGLSTSVSKDIDNSYILYYNLKRIGVLSKRIDMSSFIGNNDDDEDRLEVFCNFISDGIAHRLTTIQSKLLDGDQQDDVEDQTNAPKEKNKRFLQITALLIYEGLLFLLSTTAWKVKEMLEQNKLILDNDDLLKLVEEKTGNEQDVDHVAIHLRNRLIVLVELCFEQHLPKSDEGYNFSAAQHEWSDSVQEIGGLISSDLRTLFIQEWTNASSPLLRAAAITEDSRLIAGYVRYFCSKESEIKEDEEIARSLLLPLTRSLTSNWKLGNRREASYALSHITGSGAVATDIIDSFSRLLKRIEPVRLLEAHMASLRLSYEKWLNNDPEEMMGDNLTQGTDDITMNAFQELELKHEKQFKNLLNQAQRFSTSLGVRKLSDDRLSPGLLGFMLEGVRYSFSGADDLLLGCRLSFLSILSKYAPWIKKSKAHLWEVAQYLHKQETELKSQEIDERETTGDDFEGIHEADLQALTDFRSSLSFKASSIFSLNDSKSDFDSRTPDSSQYQRTQISSDISLEESRDVVGDMSTMSLPSSTRARRSRGSSGSALSKMSSTRSSLSPLYEAKDGEDDESPNSETHHKSTESQSEIMEGRSQYNEATTLGSITPKGTGLTSGYADDDKNSFNEDYSQSTGFKSELTALREDEFQNVAKTQSTFDGEQSVYESEVGSEILESPHQ